MSLLSLRHVSKRYLDGRQQRTVLDDVSLEIDPGDFVGVWGMRRSGKTTLLRVAAGTELPDEGEVCFDGHDMTKLSTDARARLQRHDGIGLVWTDWRPGRNKPVLEHVALPLLSDGMSLRSAKEPAHRALARLGISGCAYMSVDRLSRVERIRVGLAQALVHQPRLLLVDEPSVPLRPSEAVDLHGLLRSLGQDSSIAIVLASEDIGPIRSARRMMSIDSGKLRSMDQQGTVLAFPDPRLTARTRQQR
ncbi:MAG: ATP-binding cassette domain-containing protein [Solirubrobacteraceae bacterium]|jgi:ABC-type ATPase involved in cell division